VHETPKGGKIDVQTGAVTLNGAVVDNFAPCTVDWQLQTPEKTNSGGTTPPSTTGWYIWSDAQWVSISGANRPFDEFDEFWTVPNNPSPPSGDSPLEYIWYGLQNNQGLSSNGTGCGSSGNIVLIQPVLQWGSNGSNGGAFWSIASWQVWGCNSSCGSCSTAHSTYETTAAGRTISGFVYQVASNLDEWEIYTMDSSGTYTYDYIWNIPNAWPKFGSAQGGVLENYGISSCQDFSPSNSVTFNDNGTYAAYPSWNSFDAVDSLMSWGGWWTNPSPSCSWGVSAGSATTLSWVE
jgi:hypothetical protein